MIADAAVSRDAREKRILAAAVRAFAAHGLEGASLREIAREADVSLTLINHHFGSKSALVAATVAAIKTTCARAEARLRSKLATAGFVRTAQLIEMWIDYLEEAFGADANLPYLQLMRRLRTDPATEPTVRASLDAAEPHLRTALVSRFPQASKLDVQIGLRASCDALLSVFIGDELRGAQPPQVPRMNEAERRLLISYLSGALDSALDGPVPSFQVRIPREVNA